MDHVKQIFGDAVDFKDAKRVLKDVDAFILLTEWKQFKNPDWSWVAKEMKGTQV